MSPVASLAFMALLLSLASASASGGGDIKFDLYSRQTFTGGSTLTVNGGNITTHDSPSFLIAQISAATAIPIKHLTLYFGDTFVDPTAKTLESLGIVKANYKEGFLFTIGGPSSVPYDPTKVALKVSTVEQLCPWIGRLNGGAACVHGTNGLCSTSSCFIIIII